MVDTIVLWLADKWLAIAIFFVCLCLGLICLLLFTILKTLQYSLFYLIHLREASKAISDVEISLNKTNDNLARIFGALGVIADRVKKS